MRVSNYGNQQVPARDFWVAVVAVAPLLGGRAVYFPQAGDLPAIRVCPF